MFTFLETMSSVLHFPFFAACVILLAANVGTDCPYQKCMCSGTFAFCTARGFTSMPFITSTNYSKYTSTLFDDNLITQVPAGSLLSNQKEISFLNNPLSVIDDTVFDGSTNTLQILRFSSCRFTRIPDAFSHLNALTDLSIADTNILDWNPNAMKQIGRVMNTLYLDNVSLTTWPSWFHYFSRISELSVISNSIESLPDDALDTLATSLTSLSLYKNSLTIVPKAISKLTALQMLNLQENKIIDLTWLAKSSTLLSLSLNNNNIVDAKQLSDALRPFADTLNNVDLHNNELTEIPSLDFLVNINDLDLTNNKISDIQSGSMPPSLSALDLGFNLLSYIPSIMSDLHYVSDLRIPNNLIRVIRDTDVTIYTIVVELQSNLITEISDTSFPDNSQIKFLHLDNNPIVKISNIALQNLPVLQEIYLSNTKLTRLPLGLGSITSLNIIDFTGARNLLCTCEEKSLASLIIPLTSYNVKGNCGLTSIYNFFAILSPSCSK